MTAETGSWRVLVCLIGVTTRTVCPDMFADQRKVGRGVIKFNFEPVVRIVAIGAHFAEKILVYVVVTVTANAVTRCIAMFRCGGMTAKTIGITVFADQLEVRQ